MPALPNANPAANFPFTMTNEIVAFDGSASSDPDGDTLTFSWDFGGGATLTSTSPDTTHEYDSGSYFHGNLQVLDNKGGTANASHDVAAAPAARQDAKETIPIGTAAWVYRQLPVTVSSVGAGYNLLTATLALRAGNCGAPACSAAWLPPDPGAQMRVNVANAAAIGERIVVRSRFEVYAAHCGA